MSDGEISEQLKQYLRENYGICSRDVCSCLRTGWVGTMCPNWKPLEINSYEDLKRVQRQCSSNGG